MGRWRKGVDRLWLFERLQSSATSIRWRDAMIMQVLAEGGGNGAGGGACVALRAALRARRSGGLYGQENEPAVALVHDCSS
jgi:hypothetical protein